MFRLRQQQGEIDARERAAEVDRRAAAAPKRLEHFKAFAAERLIVHSGERVTAAMLFSAFLAWCRAIHVPLVETLSEDELRAAAVEVGGRAGDVPNRVGVPELGFEGVGLVSPGETRADLFAKLGMDEQRAAREAEDKRLRRGELQAESERFDTIIETKRSRDAGLAAAARAK